MLATETLTVGDVEGGATVLPLDDMISEETRWERHMAATTIIHGLAAIASTLENELTPCPMLRGKQLGISLLLDGSSGAHVELSDLGTDLFRHYTLTLMTEMYPATKSERKRALFSSTVLQYSTDIENVEHYDGGCAPEALAVGLCLSGLGVYARGGGRERKHDFVSVWQITFFSGWPMSPDAPVLSPSMSPFRRTHKGLRVRRCPLAVPRFSRNSFDTDCG